MAAGLGKMKVLSTLGAPFKAELELSNMRPEEEINLLAKIASPEVFKQAGIDYNPALAGIRATLNKDGGVTTVLLSSSTTVNEPLLEVLIELSWQSGRLVRQYTVLLDPGTPLVDPPAPVAAVEAPQATVVQALAPAPAMDKSALTSAPAAPAAPSKAITKASDTELSNKPNYDVQRGDTLYGIASRMNNGDNAQVKALMANLFRNNPQAFIGKNMNKLKAGVVLNTDGASVAPRMSASLATGASSQAFSQYKQAAAIKTKPLRASKDDSKTISSAVKPAAKAAVTASAQDQLKVAGSAAVGNKALPPVGKRSEEAIAREREAAEKKSQIATLEKNTKELQKTLEVKNNALAAAIPSPAPAPTPAAKPAASVAPAPSSVASSAAASTAVVAAAATAASTPVVPAPATSATPSVAPASSVSSAKPLSTTDATVAQLNTPAEAKKPTEAKPVLPTSAPQVNWYDGIDPLTIGGAAGAAALGGLLLYRRRKAKQDSTEFADSQFSPKDTQGTLLTGEGGQAVDTFNSVFVSSFAEGNAPLESAEVDPVAEADVYMQYGRDAHAEDILKDALKQNPNRHPVRLKLMELYASKRNTDALNTQFDALSQLTQASGDDWEAGQQIMAATQGNTTLIKAAQSSKSSSIASLIQPSDAAKGSVPMINLSEPTMIGDVPSMSQAPSKTKPTANLSIDNAMPINLATTIMKSSDRSPKGNADMLNFDMDSPTTFSAPSLPSSSGVAPSASKPPSAASLAFPSVSLGSATAISAPSVLSSAFPGASPGVSPGVSPSTPPSVNVAAKPVAALTPAAAAIVSPNSSIEFNVSKYDINPPSIFDKVTGDTVNSSVQAIETKFSLAQAYMDIGDKEGAKELLHEVLESGHQSLAAQAKAMLQKI